MTLIIVIIDRQHIYKHAIALQSWIWTAWPMMKRSLRSIRKVEGHPTRKTFPRKNLLHQKQNQSGHQLIKACRKCWVCREIANIIYLSSHQFVFTRLLKDSNTLIKQPLEIYLTLQTSRIQISLADRNLCLIQSHYRRPQKAQNHQWKWIHLKGINSEERLNQKAIIQ